jgi:hypothetical protein
MPTVSATKLTKQKQPEAIFDTADRNAATVPPPHNRNAPFAPVAFDASSRYGKSGLAPRGGVPREEVLDAGFG